MCKDLLLVHSTAWPWYVILNDDWVLEVISWTLQSKYCTITEDIISQVNKQWFYPLTNLYVWRTWKELPCSKQG